MKTKAVMLVLAMMIFAFSCQKEENTNENQNQKVNLSFRLTDAPGDYDAVNIEVLSVSVQVDSAWYQFDLTNPGVYDLISLSNGNSILLVSGVTVPAGTINQMRLHLGDNNTIVVGSISYELTTPSGQTSGYKIKMDPTPIAAGVSYQVLIDFDAEKSIVKTGNGKYILKPVVRGSLETAIGQIDGIVVPAYGASLASAWNATDTFNVYPDSSGFFLINSLLPGAYTVKITADTPYMDTIFLNIPVTAGQVTHMDSIFLAQ